MILTLLFSFIASIATPIDTSIHTIIEAQAIVSDAGATPLWIRSLQYGSVPMENPGLILRAWNGKNYNLKKKYDWKYEVEATGWTGKQNDFWLTQAYVSGRRGKWELWAGRRKEVYGLGDTTMTGGFYAWSGNALPMPKIQLGTRDYLNFAKGWLGIHMTYSHGWFDNQGPTINAYLHQKTFYGRIGKPNSLVTLFGGLNHNVSWGGESKVKVGNEYDYYPSNFSTYFYVVTILKDRSLLAIDPKASMNDIGYQFGNHLGSIDFAIKLQTEKIESLIYRQSMYETGRIVNLTLINDGLSGFSVKLKKKHLINKFGIEYMYTANQGNYTSAIAELLGFKDPHKIEVESYLNNGARGPWIYWGKSIGSPIFILDKDRINGGGYYFSLNAIKSYHIFFSGNIRSNLIWDFRMLNSCYAAPRSHLFNRLTNIDFINQRSIYFSVEKKISAFIKYKIQISADHGLALKNAIGAGFSINYSLR